MLKRTLFFGSPARLRVQNAQLLYEAKDEKGNDVRRTIPLEDIGYIVVESLQISISAYCLNELMKNNCVVIFCDEKHLPSSQLLPFCGNSLATKNMGMQLKATDALCNQLWRQTVTAKIQNQARCLEKLSFPSGPLLYLARGVKSGDRDNAEAVAARYYFDTLGGVGFNRRDENISPNLALNYGYALLRAAVARAIASSGLLCVKGIHHANQYDAFCLADDIMEPYRPFFDELIFSKRDFFLGTLDREQKAELLKGLMVDVMIGNCRRPLANAISFTTASLVRCFLGEEKKIVYPVFPDGGI